MEGTPRGTSFDPTSRSAAGTCAAPLAPSNLAERGPSPLGVVRTGNGKPNMSVQVDVRRFSIGDALILMAALCVGLSGIRERIQTFPTRAHRWFGDYRRFQAELAGPAPMSPEDYRFTVNSLAFYVSDEGQAWLSSVLIGLTPAQVLMRLKRPRPNLKSLGSQPGFVGCCGALMGYTIDRGWILYLRFPVLLPPLLTTLGVVVAWAILPILSRWEPEASWIDRLGIGVGMGWIVAESWSLLEQAYLW